LPSRKSSKGNSDLVSLFHLGPTMRNNFGSDGRVVAFYLSDSFANLDLRCLPLSKHSGNQLAVNKKLEGSKDCVVLRLRGPLSSQRPTNRAGGAWSIVKSIPRIMTTMSTINSAIFALLQYLGCGSSLPLPPRLQFDNQPAVNKLLETSKRWSSLGLSGLCIAGGLKKRLNGAWLIDNSLPRKSWPPCRQSTR
jgi:hypothetical protein